MLHACHTLDACTCIPTEFSDLKMVLNAQKGRQCPNSINTCHIPVFFAVNVQINVLYLFCKTWNGTVWAKHIRINHCHYQFNLKSKHVFPETYYFVSKIFLVPSFHNQELFCFTTISRHLLRRLHYRRIVYTNSTLNLQFLVVILGYTKFCHFIV